MCEHSHTKEHVQYHVGGGYTEYNDGEEAEFDYTLKHRLVVCVHCLFVMKSSLSRVVYLVIPKRGTNIIKSYNLKTDAVEYAKYVDGYWIEAELEGSM